MKDFFSIFRSQRGQATTAAMILIPVTLLVITTLAILGFAFIFEANATAKCRASLGESQTEASRALEKLLALNPKARVLEGRHQAALLQLEIAFASGSPIAASVAQANLRIIKAQQRPVRAEQLRWIAKGRAASLAAPERAQASLRSALPDAVRTKVTTQPNLKQARFDVIAEGPPGALTPSYRTAPGFEKSQRAEVSWLLQLPRTSNDEDEVSPKINVGCAMTLTKEGDGRWSPRILEDKLLRN